MKNVCLSILLVYVTLVTAQEIPPIQVFTPQEYSAEDQNWAISQSSEKFIYLANNKGLLEYNGDAWKLYNSPNESIIRSVLATERLIYTGAYMDFGYWEKDETNRLQYTSIVKENAVPVIEDEEFWGILEVDGFVIFQSFERIYIFNTQNSSFKIIDARKRINKIFQVNSDIYFHEIGLGIFRIENGKAIMEVPSNAFGFNEIINIFNQQGNLLLLTKDNGLLKYSNKDPQENSIGANRLLKERTVYSGIKLADGTIIIGTISNGIIQISEDGELLLEIDQFKGLSNNTVLALFEDIDGNVWLGLDNGINVINLKSPFRVYTDKLGQLGTIYTSIVVGNYLYLGTNQGLFYKKRDDTSAFKMVSGTNGQVWSLDSIEGIVLCGHDNGTFIIENDSAKLISRIKGTWGVKQIPSNTNLLLQGNYKGLHILERNGGSWVYRNKLEGFDISSRYFEFTSDSEVLVSHEYKGIYQIKIDQGLFNVTNYEKLNLPAGIKSSITTYDGEVLYAFGEGVFKFDSAQRDFKKDSIFSKELSNSKYLSGKLIADKTKNRLWAFTKNDIVYIEPGQMTQKPDLNSIAIPEDLRKNKAGFENILHLKNEKYLIGTTTGYFILDLAKIETPQNEITFNSIASYVGQNPKKYLTVNESPKLSNAQNNISFSYSVPIFNEYSHKQYQYKLVGLYDSWSDWSTSPEVTFENLPYGNYIFQARAKVGNTDTINTLSYRFSIDKPWYLKPLAIAFYIMAFLLIGFIMHYANRQYYKKQKNKLLQKKEQERELEKLENQKQLMEFKNENLKLDIENKNRELGIATMNLVKRNELLNDIKTALSKIKSIEETKKVIRLINNNLNDSNDWKLFEEAFNNVDKDFMKRVKTLHPSITPNDLRLCAYLRLNLSSKEIAPLLNISHKSVEVKRYRLRKKMGLDHDKSLTNYILEL
ncbi:LuxR family transcriptional regulator [Winogradskyella sp. DF17]|uniref:LuxR family transcriptional regulator n=1 Tax=Winogradskyella pelagia TaxID=2819984 RepID=A0ABS3T302_9FLAO|nr:triple tyrosine motif-containing protein [Winogradskyella sp. DF17]MBO3117119.1 LuxR family transcriptional regulator [Winogradskyella sp. DF17]